jgi:MFS superfamily sulfate permease-like transporter/nucleotide-binding universal stress UspA family protein
MAPPAVRVPEVQVAPQNGIQGLKHWKQDALAGLVVALVSVPLSLGIALSSGAPPICGLTSEIVAGLIFPLLGGAYVTISGPAAGLAPVLYSSILTLGHGNMDTGYRMVTGVIMMAGLVQLILTWLKAARFSYLFPSAAIQGMLASIGFMLIAKQIPNFIGHPYKAHEFWGMVSETPKEVVQFQPQVVAISSICLAILFLLPRLRISRLHSFPPQLFVVVVAVLLAHFWHLDPKFLVSIPANLLEHGIVTPDFHALFSDPGLVGSIIVAVLTLTFVDGTESLATILAVDKIDPWHRKSSPDRTLFAMGISNICSSLIGGLTIIPGIIKSTTCIHSGGRTAWVNFYNAAFLITFLVAASSIIKMIPMGALAAVLVHIGWKLAGPHKWKHMWSTGTEQMLVFVLTIIVTVSTDLLVGIMAGIMLKIALLIFFSSRAAGKFEPASFIRLFQNPIANIDYGSDATRIEFDGPVVCFNSLYLRAACDKAVSHGKTIRLQFLSAVNIVDHSSSTFLQSFQQDCKRIGIAVTLEGLSGLKSRAFGRTSLKYRPPVHAVPTHGLKVLVAIDNSEHSRIAIDEVAKTPWPKGSQLIVATVLNMPFGMTILPQHEEKAQALVDSAASSIINANSSFENSSSLVLKGETKSELYYLMEESRPDILVTGARLKRRMESISHALLLSAHCSVRICRPRISAEGKRILLALDESKFSTNALEQVACRPWADGTEFLCVTAVPTISGYLTQYPDWYEIEELELNRNKQAQSVQRMLEEARQLLASQLPKCNIRTLMVDGEPREALLKVAEEEQIDLIVAGSAGKNFAERLVVGSVSEAMAVWANCSVEIIQVMSFSNENGHAGEGAGEH